MTYQTRNILIFFLLLTVGIFPACSNSGVTDDGEPKITHEEFFQMVTAEQVLELEVINGERAIVTLHDGTIHKFDIPDAEEWGAKFTEVNSNGQVDKLTFTTEEFVPPSE